MALTQPLRFILLSLILLSLTFTSASQRIITNDTGDRVVVYPDGSWRYTEPGDSLLINTDPYQNENPPTNEAQSMNEGEQYEFLLRQWTDLYSAIKQEKIEAQKKFRDATNAKFKASEEFHNAEANKKLLEPDMLANREDRFDNSIIVLKQAKKQQNSIKLILEKADKVHAFLSKLNEKKVSKIRTQFNQYLKDFEPQSAQVRDQKSQKKKKSKPASKSTPYGDVGHRHTVLAMDPGMVHERPAYFDHKAYRSRPFDCSFATDSVDLISGRTRLETNPGLLFTYTEPELRPYFKDKDLMKCRGRLSKLGPYVYLTIEFQIASSHSQSNFGSLQSGSLLRFQLMNEESVSLYNIKTNTGRIDPYSGHTIFTGQYALGKKELNALEKSGLDKMRVMWSTGFEDYDVYYMDLLMNQINCLEKGSHK